MLVAPLGREGDFCGSDALTTTAELHRGDDGVCSLSQGGLVWSELSCRHPPVGSNCTALQEEAWVTMFPGLGAALIQGLQIRPRGDTCPSLQQWMWLWYGFNTYIDITGVK